MFKNTVKTVVLLAGIGVLFMVVGSFFGTGGLVIGLGLGVVFVGGSYWFSDKLAVKAAGAVPVTEAEQPKLYAIVRDLTSRTGMPMPAIYLSPAAQPNAFATGRNPRPRRGRGHAGTAPDRRRRRAAGRARARALARREPRHPDHVGGGRGRDGHHVRRAHGDVGCDLRRHGRRQPRNRGGQNMFGALAMMILAPIAAVMLQMALSRSREFEADHSGAELLGNGEPLARALEKIDAYAKQVPMNVDPAQATAYIINPLAGRKVNFSGLFQTHPPTAERIARLRGQA